MVVDTESVSVETDDARGSGGDSELVAMPEDPALRNEVRALVLARAKRAVERLAQLMECSGRQSMVALGACREILSAAMKDTGDEEDLSKLTDEQLHARHLRGS